MTNEQLLQAMADAMRDLMVVIAGISDNKDEAIAAARDLIAQAKERANG
ncbi:hypothetical protein J2W88_003947 [Acidovorax delafieldii]|uniref:Uncharacterized protein n=1 Tax=Acidovorax delafieldii TaxID=47920 RepID=A0AAJ2BZA2_ACIDE|nr:hypothetical protein [Acidovorax delafieldii]MDR6768643.1 hypothetical protein [Acidovorax delafieldii]MDR6837358.1 hypothetical protein [Acidovorax delafieldii]MDR7366849.1 hypothetical protein [Acidovorax delafieldii]